MNRASFSRGLALWLPLGVCVSVVVLTWLGYQSLWEWQRSALLLSNRRAGETADLFVMALARDMRAVQNGVLVSRHWDGYMLDSPYDLSLLVAGAFARYPYPESFFAARGLPEPSRMVFFNRADRLPPWMPASAEPRRFPVRVATAPAEASRIADRILRDVEQGRRFSIFEVSVEGVAYQVVARLMYRDYLHEQLEGVFGFTVNLPWVREHYFPELTEQIAKIGPLADDFRLAILDEQDRLVAQSARSQRRVADNRRILSLMFFDPELVAFDPPPDLPPRAWAVEIEDLSDASPGRAIESTNRTLIAAAFSALTLAVGFVLIARATRSRAQLAELRSEFVSTVTHDLKTPLATIRAVGDTLVSGRLASSDAQREYAQLVVQESKRLTRLVDNLLAYARITDVTEAYSFEPLPVAMLVDDVLQRFRSLLAERTFAVEVDVPASLPSIRADRVAMELLLDNLVDNAIRYSRERRRIRIAADRRPSGIRIAVIDRGVGIPEDELQHVVRRFFRGRRAGSGGSGLGLAIADRIATDHGGTLTIDSVVDTGTSVAVTIPIATEDEEGSDRESGDR
jgi:signal transduction histidine kinase